MQEKMQLTPPCNNIPSREDWGDLTGDFDKSDAFDRFYGKSNREMQIAFSRDPTMRAQDIRFMPRFPFIYYMQGFIDFVLNGTYGNDAPDIANCLLDVVAERMEANSSEVNAIFTPLSKVLDFIVINDKKFNTYPEIYGNLAEKACSIKETLIYYPE